MKLTDAICRKVAAPAKGNRIYYDGHGFGLRVTAAGARSFILSYRTSEGRARRLTIGDFGAWSLAAARAEAADLRRQIDQGGDPLGERQDERTAETVHRYRSPSSANIGDSALSGEPLLGRLLQNVRAGDPLAHARRQSVQGRSAQPRTRPRAIPDR